MKTSLAASLFALALSLAGSHYATAAPGVQASTNAPLTEAVVKKVDKQAGQVTLVHGPLPNGMPAMTMAFRLKDRAWADQIKEGTKIRFAADQIDGSMTVVRYELVK
ncbi:MAG TPA: copper-binding protein [Rhodocyclaceae bacterium]|nr:copper-binding protein [Rhodocyclaceae bacterium]